MAHYPTVLFDLDHTLFDSEASERLAFRGAFEAAGVADPDRYLDPYLRINAALWASVERGERTAMEVRVLRFEQLVDACSLDADPTTLADAFVLGLGACGDLYPGAGATLEALAAGDVTMALVTNGLREVQRSRLVRLGLAERFATVVISGEVGVAKPSAAFFDLVFAQLGHPAPPTVLMVGDSLSADMAGGAAYGTATCWYNPHCRHPGTQPIDHVINTLDELPAVVGVTE